MSDKRPTLQDTFLAHVQANQTPLTIFLVNGVKLSGVVVSYDSFCLLLVRGGHAQLVFKRAINSVMPDRPIELNPVKE
jgi:host factor-I protein